MKIKYKISLVMILVMLTICIFIGADYIKYKNKEEQTMAMVKVKSGLSINYLNGSKVNTTAESYQLDFSVTNLSDSEAYYYIRLNNEEFDDNVVYKINEEEQVSLTKTTIKNQEKINSGETKRYSIVFLNPSKKTLKTELLIDTIIVDKSLKSILLNTNQITNAKTINYQEPETTNNYFVEQTTDTGNVYYFRGKVDNNYLSFAGYMWRIVKANADGTVTLILNDVLEENQPFNEQNNAETTNFLESGIYNYLKNWYDLNLKEYDDYIANAKYCTDDNAELEENGTIYYLPEQRIFTLYSPVPNCPGTTNTAKIGLLTADDAMIAGASDTANNEFYLNSPKEWWTMTLNKKENQNYSYITVNQEGTLIKNQTENLSRGIKPVINLIKKLNVLGKGTIDDPYTVFLM